MAKNTTIETKAAAKTTMSTVGPSIEYSSSQVYRVEPARADPSEIRVWVHCSHGVVRLEDHIDPDIWMPWRAAAAPLFPAPYSIGRPAISNYNFRNYEALTKSATINQDECGMAQAFCGRVLDPTTAFMAATARSVLRHQDTRRKKIMRSVVRIVTAGLLLF